MNLYNYHSDPESIHGYEERFKRIPSEAANYASRNMKPFPAGEAAIAKDGMHSYRYALNILKGRFPAGEAAIAKDPKAAMLYATKILKHRWPEAEETFIKHVRSYKAREAADAYASHFGIHFWYDPAEFFDSVEDVWKRHPDYEGSY